MSCKAKLSFFLLEEVDDLLWRLVDGCTFPKQGMMESGKEYFSGLQGSTSKVMSYIWLMEWHFLLLIWG